MMTEPARIAAALRTRAAQHKRFMVAIAGPPGSGKTTLADEICMELRSAGDTAVVVPMDGFHFDDIILNARGHRARKGAAHTFDAPGFENLLKRIKVSEPDIAIPVFDRTMELSRAAADIVDGSTKFILVEGLYLLLDKHPWNNLKQLFDHTIFLDVPAGELERRLTQRILSHGHDLAYAKNWIASNDLLNMRDVIDHSVRADEVITNV
jgi:pantothenate kinase